MSSTRRVVIWEWRHTAGALSMNYWASGVERQGIVSSSEEVSAAPPGFHIPALRWE